LQIDLDVTAHGRLIGELDNGATKVRPTFDAEEAGVKYSDGASVQGAQAVAAEALLLPDGLDQALGWRLGDFVERGRKAALLPPTAVEAGVGLGHADCFCAEPRAKSSAAIAEYN
jgi:hypothetical protein